MALGPALRESLPSFLPTWLANVPGFRNLYSIVWSIALLGDCLREIADEAQDAACPGLGTPTANPLIGASRGILQGPSEPDASFAARAIAFRDTQRGAGSPKRLAEEVQAYLTGLGSLGAGVKPVVRVVDRSGRAVTANADGTFTFSTISWNWDETSGLVDEVRLEPPAIVDGWWSDRWIIIQDPFTHYSGFTDPAWIAAWNSGDQTLDSLCPQSVVQGVMSLIGIWKGAHTWVRAVIWTANVAAFAPNGSDGNASINVGGVQTQQRSSANSYWTPVGGG